MNIGKQQPEAKHVYTTIPTRSVFFLRKNTCLWNSSVKKGGSKMHCDREEEVRPTIQVARSPFGATVTRKERRRNRKRTSHDSSESPTPWYRRRKYVEKRGRRPWSPALRGSPTYSPAPTRSRNYDVHPKCRSPRSFHSWETPLSDASLSSDPSRSSRERIPVRSSRSGRLSSRRRRNRSSSRSLMNSSCGISRSPQDRKHQHRNSYRRSYSSWREVRSFGSPETRSSRRRRSSSSTSSWEASRSSPLSSRDRSSSNSSESHVSS